MSDLDKTTVKVRAGTGQNPCEIQHCQGCGSGHCEGKKS